MNRLPRLMVGVLLLTLVPTASIRAGSLKSENFTLQAVGFGPVSIVPMSSLGPPTVLNSGATVQRITDTSVDINWKTSQDANSIVEYGTTSSMGTETGKYTTLSTDHTITVTGLSSVTRYFFRVKSVNTEGLTGVSNPSTFTTLAPKGIVGVSVSDITYSSAIVKWETGGATRSSLRYGIGQTYDKEINDSSTSLTTNHAVKLENLSSGATYHLIISATSEDGSVEKSTDISFSTNPEPKIVSLEVTPTSAHDATVRWVSNVPASGIFSYGVKEKNRMTSLGVSELKAEQSVLLSNLLDNTEYAMKLVITDGNGKQATEEAKTFTMPQDKDAPKISNLKVSVNLTGNDVVMTATWSTNKLCMGKGNVGPKASGGKGAATLPEPSAVADHILVKTGLNPSTLYMLAVECTDIQGNVGEAKISFITPAVQKGIFALIADSFAQTFGWLGKVVGQ